MLMVSGEGRHYCLMTTQPAELKGHSGKKQMLQEFSKHKQLERIHFIMFSQ